MFSTRAEEFFTGQVIKSDSANNNVYLKEFGTQAIPMIGLDFEVIYYDTIWNGTKNITTKKKAKITQLVPAKGSTVVVCREMGTHRLPRCFGRLIGKKWIETGTD